MLQTMSPTGDFQWAICKKNVAKYTIYICTLIRLITYQMLVITYCTHYVGCIDIPHAMVTWSYHTWQYHMPFWPCSICCFSIALVLSPFTHMMVIITTYCINIAVCMNFNMIYIGWYLKINKEIILKWVQTAIFTTISDLVLQS